MVFRRPDVDATTNEDNGTAQEEGILIPWVSEPNGSYLYYDCAVGTLLDNGIVVHNRLPQVDRTPDTLSSIDFDSTNLGGVINDGVSLKCQDQYQDIVQRMAHSRYWFRLWGQAIRLGYKVPIPSLKSVGGVPAIPYDKNPQWGFNRIVPGGNFGGIPLWYARWSLWYTIVTPPVNNYIPATNPVARVRGTDKLPIDGIQSPFSIPDDNAKSFTLSTPGVIPGITIGKK